MRHRHTHRHTSRHLHRGARRRRRRLSAAILVLLTVCGALLTASAASARPPSIAPVTPLLVRDVGWGSFDVDWFLPLGADTTRLVVARDAAMQDVVWTQESQAWHEHVQVRGVLSETTTYFLQVTPLAGGHEGTPSQVQSLTTRLAPPGDLDAVDVEGVRTDGFTLAWHAVERATRYRVVVSAHADLSAPFLDTPVSATSLRVAAPRDGARYYASVTPVRLDMTGAPTTTSVAVPLKKLGKAGRPTALPASGGAFDVQWPKVTNATGYTVSIGTSRDGKARWTSKQTTATHLRTPAIRVKALRGVVWVRVTANRWGQASRTSVAVPTVRMAGKVTGKPALVLKVASYNLLEPKYATPDGDGWRTRFRASGKALRGYDVVGLQEAPATYRGGSPQAVVAKAAGLTLATHPRSDKDCAAGKVPLLYRASRFDLRSCGSVDVSVARHDQRRYLTWAVLRDTATGRSVFVADTHLTARVANGSTTVAQRDRLRQARKVAAAIAARNTRDLPVILMGDLNTYLGRAAVTPVDVLADAGLADSELTAAKRVGAQWNSVHGFRRTSTAGHHLDHVLTSAGTRVLRFEVSRTSERTAPSDHHRVSATVAVG